MSDRPMNVPQGQEEYRHAELVMHLSADWPNFRKKKPSKDSLWPLEWLRKVAYFPHLSKTWLGGPMTIMSSDEPPVPLGPNTKQTCLFLIADFSDWSPVILAEDKKIHFYTVVPLYTEERDFEKNHGFVPLLKRLKQGGFNAIVDVERASVAKG
jgi:hypothetical protein